MSPRSAVPEHRARIVAAHGRQCMVSLYQAFPSMREHARGGADQVRTSGVLSGAVDDKVRRRGEGNARLDRRPPDKWWPLQAERAEQGEDSAEEAFDARTLAKVLGRPGRRQAPPVLLALRVPGDDRDCAEGAMN